MTFVRGILLVVAALWLAGASPARAEWLKAETPNFVIYADWNAGDLRNYARKVERFHGMLNRFLPPKDPELLAPKLTLYITDGVSQMRQIWPGVGESVAGFYSRHENGVYAVVDRRQNSGDTTLFHEYAHHYMFQYHNSAYPGWFVEGFAEYFAPSDLSSNRIRYGLWRESRLYALQKPTGWYPMEDLLRSRMAFRSGEQANAFYAQAWLLTHYMLGASERNRRFSAYLDAVMNGADPVEALQTHFSMTPEQLRVELRSYLQRGMTVYTLAEGVRDAEPVITPMPASTRDALWLGVRAARSLGDDGPELLARARAVADRYPGDRLAAVTLAKYLVATDDDAGAQTLLEPVVAAHPEDAEARWLLATALMNRAEGLEDDAAKAALARQATPHLAAAYQADPMDFRVYVAMARNRSGAANYPTDNDVRVAESAYHLAPQIGPTAMLAARLLMRRDRHLEAAGILAPLANSPHRGEGYDTVRRMWLDARQKAGLSVPEEAAPEAETPSEEAPAEPPPAEPAPT